MPLQNDFIHGQWEVDWVIWGWGWGGLVGVGPKPEIQQRYNNTHSEFISPPSLAESLQCSVTFNETNSCAVSFRTWQRHRAQLHVVLAKARSENSRQAREIGPPDKELFLSFFSFFFPSFSMSSVSSTSGGELSDESGFRTKGHIHEANYAQNSFEDTNTKFGNESWWSV